MCRRTMLMQESAVVQVFGRRDDEPNHALRRAGG